MQNQLLYKLCSPLLLYFVISVISLQVYPASMATPSGALTWLSADQRSLRTQTCCVAGNYGY